MGVDILAKGGPVMVVLLGLSIYALAVIFYKIFQLVGSGVFETRFIDPVMSYVKRGELTAAENQIRHQRGPVAHIMRVAITCILNRNMSQKSREAEIGRVGSAEIHRLESHMRGLEMVATTSPLLGLLGTVMGMVTVFARLADAGPRVDPSILAGGIWEALITTVGGLVVAIPAVAAYYIIDGIIEKVRARMRDVTVQILALEDEFIRNEQEQARREMIEAERLRQESIQRDNEAQQKRLRELQEAAERAEKAMEQVRSVAQGSGTLKLLSPSYTKF